MKKNTSISMITSGHPVAAIIMLSVCLTSLCLIGCAGCGGVKEKGINKPNESIEAPNELEASSKDIMSEFETQDTFKHPSDTFQKSINGKNFALELTGQFRKNFKFEGYEDPLQVHEVYPGIVKYEKYDSIRFIPYHQEDSIWYTLEVEDKVEFYDKGELVNTVYIDEINPYLKIDGIVKIMNHYSDAEGTDVLLERKQDEMYPIDTYHLRQSIKNHGAYTTVNFWKNEITNGLIIHSPTTIIVFDSLGQQVFEHEFERFMSTPAIDPEGKFLMIAISGVETVNTSGAKFQNDGFELWQIQPKKILHRELNDNPNMRVDSSFEGDDSFLLTRFTFPNDRLRGQRIFAFNVNLLKLDFVDFTTSQWEAISLSWFKEYKTYDRLFTKYGLTTKELNYDK